MFHMGYIIDHATFLSIDCLFVLHFYMPFYAIVQLYTVGSFTKPRKCTLHVVHGETRNFLGYFAFRYILASFRLKAYFKFI